MDHAPVSSLVVQARVINALILRDMRTRFGRSHFGYLIAILWPFVHIFVIVAIFAVMGRAAPVGDDVVLFLATGLTPYIIFLYVSRNIMISVMSNKPLLYFPSVKVIDIVLARWVLEFITAFAVIFLCMAALWAGDSDPIPRNIPEAVLACLATVLFATGLGVLNAVICCLAPMYATAYLLVTVTLYISSGIMFIPEALPQEARDALLWNPLLHCVGWLRSAYYPGYGETVDRLYVVLFGGTSLVIGLLGERWVRTHAASS